MASKSPEAVAKATHSSSLVHKNKLTQCFDDIMRVAAEMMLHQQLKTVQLDCSVVNGFSYNQQRVLGEKIHVFHAILDDMETTLDKSKSYVEAVYEIGREKEIKKEREREELRRRQEEEERKTKEQEELKRRQEMELKAQAQQAQQQQQQQHHQQNGVSNPGPKMEFPMDSSGSLLADFPGSERAPVERNAAQSQKVSSDSMQPSLSASPQLGSNAAPSAGGRVKQEQGLPQHDLGDLGSMDISMFPSMDTGFDMGNFNSETDAAKMNGHSDAAASMARPDDGNDIGATMDDPSNNGLVDNNDDYLTLNDFNDLNIDWAATGDPGDLDLNGFNI
ncbi:MED2 (YDL005C) [Zygosaccharomyces parabailii]|nr:MED2 (YDL005C) [Zygosaccharomyces parabailii]CDH10322.1 uncharacterized protein ZBAI_02107 [Zygosaccharomyces bailii ISA1307]